METVTKTVWLVGKKLQNQDIQENLEMEGYVVRGFHDDKFSLTDDQPDLVIFSEAEIKGFEILVKLRNFYPATTIMSVPEAQIEKMIQKAPERGQATNKVPESGPDDFQESVNRLIDSILKIEDDNEE
ncbi:hypothetical protein [Parachryseolinea silvisoli]|uniref:hypothetical protein n=1 Tax=Parachryseolinea silvisoli TaxID=2873601 RepID=UPI002265A3EA|nr:hypothetical protein [Parachryseolinea silvisoli]MCD9014477.1 hypothetical protein [Parachryseolinea silvisoli]